jgi:hypothetical protein
VEFASKKLNWRITLALVSLAVLLPAGRARGDTYVLDFESFSDSTPLTNQYSSLGLTFSNATVISAGISLNEFDFPPYSGTNVAFDEGGPINLSLEFPATFVGAYFTYLQPLTIDAFNSGGQLVASAISIYSANDVSSGNPPNEFLSVSASDIADVTFTASPIGGSFTMDDLSLTIPEPSPLLLVGTGITALTMLRLRLKRKT